jgi:hypothetical protein
MSEKNSEAPTPDAAPAPSRTFSSRALETAKSPWAGVLALIPILFGLYLDYRASVSQLDQGQDEDRSKSESAEDARIRVDKEHQEKMQYLWDYILTTEARLAVLEEKAKGVEIAPLEAQPEETETKGEGEGEGKARSGKGKGKKKSDRSSGKGSKSEKPHPRDLLPPPPKDLEFGPLEGPP